MPSFSIMKESIVFQLGKWQELPVYSKGSIGAFLGDEQKRVLLPAKQVPQDAQPGDVLRVFLYKDSQDRLIATVHEPKLVVGEVAVLRVKQVAPIGAFLDWGLEKDLFLPFRQQTKQPEEGMFYPVALYVDKSERLAATMWVDKYLKGDPDEKKKQLSLLRLRADAENVYVKITRMQGHLPYNDKADPELIEKDFSLSKNAFKRAVGVLYKERRLVIKDDCIDLV